MPNIRIGQIRQGFLDGSHSNPYSLQETISMDTVTMTLIRFRAKLTEYEDKPLAGDDKVAALRALYASFPPSKM